MITSVTYTSPETAVAITMDDGTVWQCDASLPADTDIRRQLAEWIAAGGVIAPYVAPMPPVPVSVTAFQAKAALLNAGLLDKAQAAVSAAAPIVQLAWATAQSYERSSPTVAALAAALGLSDAQVDDLFRAAALISA